MNKLEFKELFLKLTEETIPFKMESKLEKHLPSGFKRDSVGNYYYEIGNSKTLFTTHLDTYSEENERVNHVIDENDEFIIKTDGTTILGGDNKLGCTILIGMIKNNIPGTYYFFIGEEPILSGGLYGSKKALESNPSYFQKFERCIAFDRREYGSIVVRQMGRMCCSKGFAESIADEFNIRGIKWDKDSGYGYYTDTAVFMDVIEECTNLSAGGFNEHYKTEWVDLNYTYKVFEAALEVDWESLPVERELEDRFSKSPDSGKMDQYGLFMQKRIADEIKNIFYQIGMNPTRDKNDGGVRHITFSKWLDDFDFDIYISGSKIILNEKEVSLDQLIDSVIRNFKEDIIGEIEYYSKLEDDEDDTIGDILSAFNQSDAEKFLNYLYKL